MIWGFFLNWGKGGVGEETSEASGADAKGNGE